MKNRPVRKAENKKPVWKRIERFDVIMITAVVFIFLFSFSMVLARFGVFEKKVCYEKHCFQVEIARTSAERTKGLMFRDPLKDNEAMLFVFGQEQKSSFWMKNMKFSLDIIWINKDKEIVYIKHNFQPCQSPSCPYVFPEAPAMYVLEINAGLSQKLGMKIGDKLKINY